MSTIDYTRSTFAATAWFWTTDPPEVGTFVAWREGRLDEVAYKSDSTFLGIVLSTRPLRLLEEPGTVEVTVMLAGTVYTTMYAADVNWELQAMTQQECYVSEGVLHAAVDTGVMVPVDLSVVSTAGPNDPYLAVKFDTTLQLPQDFLDERCGITTKQEEDE